LLQEADAVYMAIGARQARPLKIPGADLAGVYQGVPFIVQFSSLAPGEMPSIDPAGKRVVVLGGGDTAMDCLRTAIRGGASEALALYRRDESSMPATRKHYRNATEEGARFEFQAQPVAVVGNSEGSVTAVRCVRTRQVASGDEGEAAVQPVAGSEFEVPADIVLVAFGFDRVPCPPGSDCASLARNSAGDVIVDENQMTTMPRVFAGGDMVHGPGRLVDTVRDARRAAKAIHLYLSSRAVQSA
jgi:glutamate synthase (NADPH) small chain